MPYRKRIIPLLMLSEGILYKSVSFDKYRYIGDPLNAVRIFNDKGADEIIIIDVNVSKKNTRPNFDLIGVLATECFMPMCYGGGIRTLDDAKRIFDSGVEKISLNSTFLTNPNIATKISSEFGAQALIAAIDIIKIPSGSYQVYDYLAKKPLNIDPIQYAKNCIQQGAGEILITSVDREGTRTGYDLNYLKELCDNIEVPSIICGGANSVDDLIQASQKTNALGIAASTMFVLYGKLNSVLITYPDVEKLSDFNNSQARL